MNIVKAFTVAALLLTAGTEGVVGAEKAPKMLSHDVYFTLKDDSPKAREALVAGCEKYLSKHPGTVWFAAGARVEEHERDVNDRNFDVALHLVFKDKASHDQYQAADAHHQFIEEFEGNWESVRVFDSWLTATAHEGDTATDEHASHAHDHAHDKPAESLRLPDKANHFAGMIEGTVTGKTDRGVVMSVEKVLKTWRNSKAKDPHALEGETVRIIVLPKGRSGKLVQEFLRRLKLKERVALDVAHREGEALVILELTEEQRKRLADREPTEKQD